MNIEELHELARWINSEFQSIANSYKKVEGVLQHNSTQQQKQPLEPQIKDLKVRLGEMSMNSLTMDQSKLLDEFGVLQYIGKLGSDFLANIEHQTGLDVATALEKIKIANKKLAETQKRADDIISSLNNISLEALKPIQLDDDRCLVRIQFQNEASIENVVEWEKWSKKWVAISRGIGMSIGEAPNDVHIIGASRGSFILDLGVSAAFAKTLTGIINMVVKSAMGIIELENAREDLRHKKHLNKAIEDGMNERIKDLNTNAVEEITEKAKILALPKELDGDELTKLNASIKELLLFQKKGGGIDIIPPKIEHETNDEDDDIDHSDVYKNRLELQEQVENLREIQEHLKQLTNGVD